MFKGELARVKAKEIQVRGVRIACFYFVIL